MTFQEVQCSFKTVSKHLRRVHLMYGDKALTPADTKQFVFAMELWYFLAFDVPGLHPSTLNRQMCVLFSTPEVDVIQLGKGLDEIITQIRLIADDAYHPGSYDRFKADVGHYARIMLSMIREDVCALIACPTPLTFNTVNQFFAFPRKLLLRDIDNTEQLEQEYILTEKRVSEAPMAYMTEIKSIIDAWGLCPDYDQFLPKHGPGRTALATDTASMWKFSNFLVDERLEMFYRRHSLEIRDFLPEGFEPKPGLERFSQTLFVPKTLKTKRVISAEPAAVQYTQQGLMRVLLDAVDRCILRTRINLEHQELSRDAAKLASIDGDYATVDYSAASDSVSWQLVKSVFPVWLAMDLYCTKTDGTKLPSGLELPKLVKLSPMGSAVCFPVECLIFSAMAELACHLTHSPVNYRVYGDDVILPARAVAKLVEISTDLGFVLNKTKSYYNQGLTSYREACGMEAMNGQDVTPVCISRQFYLPEKLTPATTEIFDLLRSFHNNLREGGYHHASRLLMTLMADLFKAADNPVMQMSRLLFDWDGKRGFMTVFPTELNWHLPTRFRTKDVNLSNPCYQLVEKKCLTISSRTEYRPDDEQTIAYYEWLFKAHLRQKRQKRTTHVYRVLDAGFIDPDCLIMTNVVGRDFKLKLRWVYV